MVPGNKPPRRDERRPGVDWVGSSLATDCVDKGVEDNPVGERIDSIGGKTPVETPVAAVEERAGAD